MSHQGEEIFAFGGFQVNPRERSVTYGGQPVRITPKVFDLLLLFLLHPRKLLTKHELLDAVWSGVAVEESALARAVCDLRQALARYDETPFIETVHKFGYRFLAPVAVLALGQPADERNPAPESSPPRRKSWAWMPAIAVLVVLLVLTHSSRMPAVSVAQVRSVAVLPFQVLGQATDAEAFSIGLADAVVARLGAVRSLVVRPTSTTARYEGAAADLRQVARELRVDGVVQGTIQFMSGRARATVRLVGARDGATLWFVEIERETGHPFDLEREVGQQVAEWVTAREAPLSPASYAGPGERAAREFYFRGRGFWMRRDRASLDRAIAHFQKAIEVDPAFALAHAGLADCFLLLGLYNFLPPAEMIPKARSEVETALRLDPSLAPAYATLGLIIQNWGRDFRAAETHYRRSIAIDANYATAHHWLGELLSVEGRFAEAEAEFREAERVDPVSSIIQTDKAQLYYFSRNFEKSRRVLEQVLEFDPDFQQAHEQMALVYAAEGRETEAWQEANRLRDCQDPGSLCRLRWTAWLPARDPIAARQALSVLVSQAKGRYIPPRVLAIAYARQGRPGEAADWLLKAAQEREVGVITMPVDPLLDAVRGTPQFLAVLRGLHAATRAR